MIQGALTVAFHSLIPREVKKHYLDKEGIEPRQAAWQASNVTITPYPAKQKYLG